jgi:hypothetical protein
MEHEKYEVFLHRCRGGAQRSPVRERMLELSPKFAGLFGKYRQIAG